MRPDRPENINFYAVSNKTISNKHYDSNFYVNNNNSNSNSNNTNTNADAKYKETRNILKSFRRPPKGIHLNLEELNALTQKDKIEMFEQLDNRILALKKRVQSNKQDISSLMRKFTDIDKLVAGILNDNKNSANDCAVTPIWTQREAELAVQGLNKYGKDFNAIAQMIGIKSAVI